MLTKAKVISTDGDVAVVEVERKSACDGCHKNETGEGCSICSLTVGNRKFNAKASNRVGAKVGDAVEITSSSGRVLFYSAIVFLLPVVIAIAAFFLADSLWENETYSYVSMIVGFLLTFVGVGLYSGFVNKKRCDVEIVRVIENEGE